MRTGKLWAIVLFVTLLCGVNALAATMDELQPGDRVALTVGSFKDCTVFYGTVVCLNEHHGWVLVSFDDMGFGLPDWLIKWFWCDSTIWPHRPASLLWVPCYKLCKVVSPAPDFLDAGEKYRSFKPQTLVAGKAGQNIEVKFTVLNKGGDPSGGTLVKVYASKDTRITPSDYLLGTTVMFYLSGNGELDLTVKGAFPKDIPPGFYYIGWIIDPANQVPEEENKANNRAYVGCGRLLVSGKAPSLGLSAGLGGEIGAPGEGVYVYEQETVVPVEAVPDWDCTFAGWTGTAVSAGKVADPTSPTTEVSVDKKYTLQALFDGPHMLIDDFECYAYVLSEESKVLDWTLVWSCVFNAFVPGDHHYDRGWTVASPALLTREVKTYLDGCTPLQMSWVDGLAFPVEYENGHPCRFRPGNNTGAVVGNAEEPTKANPTVHNGEGAMAFHYYNTQSPYYSEACQDLGMVNWTATGAKKLSIWFRGCKGNMPVPMSIVVKDIYGKTAVVTHDDYEAVCQTKWTRWKIPLSKFEQAGVMLCRVKSIAIRLGDKDNVWDVGSGTVYFDDIALCHK